MKAVTLTIDENGDTMFLKSESTRVFVNSETKTQRASHVEPAASLLRFLFHAIRRNCDESSKLAAFTRLWPCLWRVNTAPVGGPILTVKDVYDWCPESCSQHNEIATWRNRQKAIDAEIAFLNDYFLNGGVMRY